MVGPAYPVKVAQAILRLIVKVCRRRRLNCKIKRLKNIKLVSARKSVQLSSDPECSDYICIIFWYILRLILTFLYELVLSPLYWFVEFFKGLKTESHIRQVFNRDKEEYQIFKKTLLFAFGLAFSWLVFFFIEYQLDVSRLTSIWLSVIILFVMTIGFTFNSEIQCVILLMLPSLFASNVRYIIIGYIFMLVYANALPNIYDNVEIIVDSIVCIVGGTGEASDSMLEIVRKIIRDIKLQWLNIKRFIMKHLEIFLDIGKFIASLFPDLRAVCEQRERNEFKEECLGGWDLFTKPSCNARKLILKGTLDLCDQLEKAMEEVKDKIEVAYNKTSEWVMQEIWFDVEMNYTLEYRYNKSKKYKEIAVDMFEDFFDQHYYLSYFNILSYSNKLILFLVTCWVIVNAWIYRKRYLSSDAFDNSYLTDQFFEIDQTRDKKNEETLIPLYVSESQYFIDPWDFQMTTTEMRKLTLGLVLFAYSLLHGGFYIAISYLIWYFAVFLRQAMQVIALLFQKPVVEVQSTDENVLGDTLGSMATSFSDTFHDYINGCQPNPTIPDRDFLKRVLTFYLIILISVFTQSYALRTRHYICGLYYPERVQQRALWLYNTILCRRGTFVVFTRKKFLRDGNDVTEEEEDITFLDYICGHFPILRAPLQLLGLYGNYKFCHVCCKRGEVDDNKEFKNCGNVDCKGVYCLDCFAQINNLCTVCMRFIDFDFGDKYSEEYDSSDEEITNKKDIK